MTMLKDRPTLGGMTVTQPPAPPHWAPGYTPTPPQPPATNRRMVVPILIVGLVAVAALIVGIVGLTDRPSPQPVATQPSAAPVGPAFTDAERAAAKERVCSTFNSVVQSIRTATNAPNGPEPIATNVNARAAIATGALALGRSVSPATPPDVAKAANALVDAYSSYLLTAFQGDTSQNGSDHAAVLTATDALTAQCA